jgi:hypothetical protein
MAKNTITDRIEKGRATACVEVTGAENKQIYAKN